ncbi:6-hexanolactone hydrolase [Ascosphaera apis ARSEF 7405]|uniref:6-hexanolactone hydrolase n=1 Tax=Ascosphaera apis ARSEF 7405 TaxID=392613 RepID=A0A167VSX5_9EURO|nr:6-hexanolactone hydrolase [Ascosphaera apis ARSEF 7405]
MASTLRTPPIKLGLFERLGLIPAVCKIVCAGLLSLIRRGGGPSSTRLRFWYTIVRTLNSVLSIRQQHHVLGYTDHVYLRFAKSENFKPDTVALKEGGLGHWIGNKNAKNVIIYFHGGGYGEGAAITLFQHARDVMNELNAAGKDHIQGVEAVRYIIDETGRSPSNIALGGDSAGGNMCLAILSHINHPHPAITPLELAEPFAAVYTTAPWVSFDITKPSMKTNVEKDFVSPAALKKWSDSFLGGQESDNYSEGVKAPAKWWEGIRTKELLICVGKDDVLFSGVDEFAQNITSVCSNVTYFAADGEPHDVPLIWRLAGVKKLSEQEKRINAFLREQF